MNVELEEAGTVVEEEALEVERRAQQREPLEGTRHVLYRFAGKSHAPTLRDRFRVCFLRADVVAHVARVEEKRNVESEQDEVHAGGKDEAARGEIPEGPAQSVESEYEKEKGVDLGTAMAHFRNEQTAADVVEEEIPTCETKRED